MKHKSFDITGIIHPALAAALRDAAIRQVATANGLDPVSWLNDSTTTKICQAVWIGPHCKAHLEVTRLKSVWMSFVFLRNARLMEEVPSVEMEYYMVQSDPVLALEALKKHLKGVRPNHNPIIEMDNMSVDAGVHATVDVKLRFTAADVNRLATLLRLVVQAQVSSF